MRITIPKPLLHVAACLALLLFTSLPAQAQRVALLVGNANYQVGSLTNPPNDVAVMEDALKAVGFKVQKVLNANQNQMKRAVRDFGTAAQGADVAFVYFSGHGTQVNGDNYLLPVGATIDKESDYAIEAIAANDVLAQIRGAQPKAAILVLDACRDNPLATTTKSATKGLGRMSAPTGTMIAFATAPGDTASDNGLYAKVLAKEMQRPGQELVDVFRNTAGEVKKLSNGTQIPRISEVSINDRFYLVSAPNPLAAPQPPVAQTAIANSIDFDHETWDLAKRRDSIQSYQAYLSVFPQGKYAVLARMALEGLQPVVQRTDPPKPASSNPSSSSQGASRISPSTTLHSTQSLVDRFTLTNSNTTIQSKPLIECKGSRFEINFSNGLSGCLSNYSINEINPLGYSFSISRITPGNGNIIITVPMPYTECPKIATISTAVLQIGNILDDLNGRVSETIRTCQTKMESLQSSCKCEAILIQGRSILSKSDFEHFFK